MDAVWQAVVRWRARTSSSELAVAMAAQFSLRGDSERAKAMEELERQQRVLHFRLAQARHEGGRHGAWRPRGGSGLSRSA
jgi:hypothetical protein